MRAEAIEFQTLLEYERDRHLVGVKFLFSEREYAKTDVKEATHQMFFCMMVKAAAVGHCIKIRKEHLYCSAASAALGFEEPEISIVTGEQLYKRNMYGTREAAADVAGKMPYLKHKVYGMCIQPLEKFFCEPDVVLSFSRPYTAMRIIQGYSYKYGFAKQLQFAGMSGICTELMAGAYKTQDIQVSFLCSGTRFAGAWRDDELGIAFPYRMFLKVLEGVRDSADIYEPDKKKKEIREKARINEVAIKLEMGKNYHGSSLGVAKMGVTGYYPKNVRKGKKCYE